MTRLASRLQEPNWKKLWTPSQTRGLVGSYSKRLESARVREEDVNVMEQSFRSELRDTDFAEASTKLTLLQTQLQAGLQSMSIANQLNLLDFLG